MCEKGNEMNESGNSCRTTQQTTAIADKDEIQKSEGNMRLCHEGVSSNSDLRLHSFFDDTTMSVHLRENAKAYAKKGVPGNWGFVEVTENQLSRSDIESIGQEIIEAAESNHKNGYIENDTTGSTIVQLGNYRIVLARPPLADGWEITAVKPVKHMDLSGYEISDKLMKRIENQAEGILIAGAPGQGKSTFAQALAEHYLGFGRVVKTIEAPRDLMLPEEITQYSLNHSSNKEIQDILLLTRPDYTVFDEMRNTSDFTMFADLRLAGIGLAGVVHATNPVDAIQRFVGRIELGVIPQVIDTIIFINAGVIGAVLSLKMKVKVPAGMTEQDLARPVVAVSDFETGRVRYELYSYGDQTILVPVRTQSVKSACFKLAERSIENLFHKYSDQAQAEMVNESRALVYLPKDAVSKVLGDGVKVISDIEKELGLSIEVRQKGQSDGKLSGTAVDFDTNVSLKNVEFIPNVLKGATLSIIVDGDFLMSARVGKNGILKIKRKHSMGKMVLDAIERKADIQLIQQ